MAGRPRTRERLLSAEAAVQEQAKDYEARLQRMHVNLIRAGLDPHAIDTDAPAPPPTLAVYDPALPLAVMRLAGAGQAIEEIRETLGFTERQEREWADQYVDFAAAMSRARTREEAFWHRQMRQAAAAGDRTSVTSIQSLVSKKFLGKEALGDGADLVVIHVHKPLAQRTTDED